MSKMGDERINQVFNSLAGGLPTDQLLESIKSIMLQEPLFQILFDETGSRINIDEVEPKVLTHTPYIQLRTASETYESSNTFLTGSIDTRILLPVSFSGDFLKKKRLAHVFYRFFISDKFREIFTMVAGFEGFNNIRFNYNAMFIVGRDRIPAIVMTLPFSLNLYRWKLENREIDYTEPLDGELNDITSYELEGYLDNETEEIIYSDIVDL